MAKSIWEPVAANRIQVGDVLSWHSSPVIADTVPDDSFRVRVVEVEETPGAELLPYITVHVVGPTGQFEKLSGIRTGRTYRQGDPVRRMLPERAARVSDENLRSVVRPGGFTSAERLAAHQAGVFPAGMIPGDL
jgi:hypothetical protein